MVPTTQRGGQTTQKNVAKAAKKKETKKVDVLAAAEQQTRAQ
jgi:hypothetical protein